MRRCDTIVFTALLLTASFGFARDDKKPADRSIAEWIDDLATQNYSKRKAATDALIEIGRPAVKPLLELIESRRKGTGQAFRTLGKMGTAARDALPVLMEIAKDDAWKAPDDWTWSTSPRDLALGGLKDMSWAADQLVPFFDKIASDKSAPERIRNSAIFGLGGMGKKAAKALRKLTKSSDAAVRDAAHVATIKALSLDEKEYYAQVLEDDPFDPKAPSYLGRTKGRYNSGRLDRLTERVKTALRERLEESPDPEVSWTLAMIIQDQLSGTSIHWAAPADGVSSRTDRENPKESFATLEKVMRTGFGSAPKGSARWKEFGIGLAKLHLLRGEWDAMNRMLVKLGQKAMPGKRRAFLAPPPVEWGEGLAATWTEADDEMRSGDCGLVLRFEKDGKGLRGVHVLIKEAPKPAKNRSFSTGIRADTLFLSPTPLSRFMGSFGYPTKDRNKARYAVSGADGIVRLERLPQMDVKFEVLIPSSNFPEAGSAWELWMRKDDGKYQRASMAPVSGAITPRSPEAQVKLVAGQTVEYPLLVVRPRFGLNVHDWARVDADSFSLRWSRVSPRPADYLLEMTLSAPQEDPGWLPKLPMLKTGEETLTRTRWDIGRRGVGGLPLEPGNIYILRVTARDESGEVVARSPPTRVWVPWDHRKCDAPETGFNREGSPPIYEGIWWRTSRNGVKLRPRIAAFYEEHPRAFEREYVRVGDAWIDWRDGDKKKAHKKLATLIAELPERNVARATAQWLVETLDSGATCPKRLNFKSFRVPEVDGAKK